MPPSPREAQLLSFGRSRLRTRIIRCPCRARAFEERDYERPCSEEGKELGGTGAGPQTGGGEGELNRATPSWVRPVCAGGVLRPDRQRDDGPRASRPKGTPPPPPHPQECFAFRPLWENPLGLWGPTLPCLLTTPAKQSHSFCEAPLKNTFFSPRPRGAAAVPGVTHSRCEVSGGGRRPPPASALSALGATRHQPSGGAGRPAALPFSC